MPGTAKTQDFNLGTATVMIGAQADLYDLVPATHSLGLVKNYSMSSEPSYTELVQGLKGSLVHSTLTSNIVRASMEVFEYTAKNLNYGLGLNGASVVANTVAGALETATVADASILVLGTGEGATFTVGDYVMVEVDSDDHVLIRKVASITTDTLTVSVAIAEVIPAGATVKKVNQVAVGSKADQPFLSAKVVGKLANGQPVVILIPKVRITRGFTLAFSTDNYGNLPFEMSIYDPVATDTFYNDFLDSAGPVGARLFRV